MEKSKLSLIIILIAMLFLTSINIIIGINSDTKNQYIDTLEQYIDTLEQWQEESVLYYCLFGEFRLYDEINKQSIHITDMDYRCVYH